MTKWERTLILEPEWSQTKCYELTLQEMAGVIAKRLRAMKPFGKGSSLDEEREYLAERFEGFPSGADVDQFDRIMDDLYDWADTRISGGIMNAVNACWIRRN